ncbi:MAG: hypothetical protein WCV88_06140 [Patescibacteria group bacterium]|jgi:hypothetical protein
MKIFETITNEIDSYLNGQVPISEGYNFSQYKLIKRLALYANGIYPKGKIDKQGNYKYWIDIIQPRIDSEVKNIDFDTKNIIAYSDSDKDSAAMLLINLSLKDWLSTNGQGVELNDAIEEGSGWGNVVWKKIKGGYERVSLKDFYVVNQQAKTLDDTPVIEKHILTQSELRAKSGTWNNNVDEVIKNCGNKSFVTIPGGASESKETPYYEIYERNGEISTQALKEAQGKSGGDENEFVLARVVVAGLKKGDKGGRYVLFAEELPGKMSDWYKEYHRGRYNGRWFRTGIIELLLDIQTRINEIRNQIARGLEWASKTLFRSQDRILANNILTDLKNGDVVKSTDLQQIPVRMEGLDQLLADEDALLKMGDKLCNSFEVVTGESMPSGTPFRLGSMLNQNANKLFDFIREKLGLSLGEVFQDWVLPDLMKYLRTKEVLRLTGDPDLMKRYYEMVVNGWYVKNLIALPPHGPEEATALKAQKLQEIQAKPEQFIKVEDDFWDGVKPRIKVDITGEGVSLPEELETLKTFVQLEQDPIRRSALIEMAMKKKGIDVSQLAKTPPQPVQQPQQEPNPQLTANAPA